MTIVKHAAFSIEVSKREVFRPPVFPFFQHSQLFATLFFAVFHDFFHWIPAFSRALIFFKTILCSSIEYAQSGRNPPNLHAHFYLIPAWCVRKRSLYSSIACVTFIKSFTPKKRTRNVFQHCLRAFPLRACARLAKYFVNCLNLINFKRKVF